MPICWEWGSDLITYLHSNRSS